MRQLKVYSLVEHNVQVSDVMDHYAYFQLYEPVPILADEPLYVSNKECVAKKIELPIRQYRTFNKEDIYVTWDRNVLELLGIEMENYQVLDSYRRVNKEISDELEAYKGMSTYDVFKLFVKKLFGSNHD